VLGARLTICNKLFVDNGLGWPYKEIAMIMEAMLILTLQTGNHPARMSTTSQMFPTMEACFRTKQRLEAVYNRRGFFNSTWEATVVCVDVR